MRLFHVSETPNIQKFVPRIPYRDDQDKTKGLVWALNARCFPNFLTPRDCPRVTYHTNEGTTPDDIAKYFSSTARHCVAIEYGWHKKMLETSLYVYEFDTANFYLQDAVGGYYVSEHTEIPIAVQRYDNLYEALFERNIEVRMLENLWPLGRQVQLSSLNWSLCRMGNAISEVNKMAYPIDMRK